MSFLDISQANNSNLTVTVYPSAFMSTENFSSTSTTDTEYYAVLRHPLYMIIIYSFAYTTIMVLAIFGNVMVVAVVATNQNMHTVINYFIVNLAIADIMVAVICLPMTLLSNLYHEWLFGWFMCKATPFLQGVSVCASVNTLAAIAVDRYLAICHYTVVKISKKVCKVIIVLIWIFAVGIMVPWAIYYNTFVYKTKFQKLTLCNELWPNGDEGRRSYFLGAIFLCCYTVPLVLIVTCYFLIAVHVWRRRAPGEKTTSSAGVVHRSKVKAVKMLCTVVVLFSLSWLPLYIIRLSNLYEWSANKDVTEIINPIAQWLGSSNSGMNPIIYVFFSKRYRHGFRNTLATCCCWRWRMNRLQNQSLSNSMAAQPYMFRNSNTRQSYMHGRGNSEKSLSNNSQKRTSYV